MRGRTSIRQRVSIALLALTIAPPAICQAEPPRKDPLVERAMNTLREIGLDPQMLPGSENYQVLYVGPRDFAEARGKSLDTNRRIFLNFIRQRTRVKINERHDKLLLIVLDTPEQMDAFFKQTTQNGGPIADKVAGYYSREHNWAVFYNHRRSKDVLELKKELESLQAALAKIRGGPQTKVVVTTPNGPLERTKAQVQRDIVNLAKQVVSAAKEFNASVTQHEAVHQLAFNVGLQHRDRPYPFWVSEGLACVFEVPPGNEKGRGRQGAARLNGMRLGQYEDLRQAGKARPLKDLVKLGFDDEWTEELYAEAWAAFDFLFHRRAEMLGRYITGLAERPQTNTPIDEAAEFQKVFQEPFDELQAAFDKYVEQQIKNLDRGK